jgi:hypothetical protein
MSYRELADVLLQMADHLDVTELLPILKDLDFSTKHLQRSGIAMAEARVILDQVLEEHVDMKNCISQDAQIIAFPDFESAIVKIQNRQEAQLTEAEKESVKPFLKENNQPAAAAAAGADINMGTDEDTFEKKMMAALNKLRSEAQGSMETKYIDTSFVYPVGNDVERLFSIAGHIYDSCRGQLELATLESQIFLKLNSHLWDAKNVHEAWLAHKHDKDTVAEDEH